MHATQRKMDQARDRVKQAEHAFCLVESGECPTCARPWGKDQVTGVTDAVIAARNAAADVINAATEKLQHARVAIEELEEEREAANKRRSEVLVALNEQKNLAAQRARLVAVLAEAEEDHDAATAKLAELQVALDAATAEQAELKTTAHVLSLTGVRSKLLADALVGVETLANTWLGRIAGWGMRLELKPYAETASGGAKDAISLQVHGAGGGHGYHAASAGERRRIDVSLLFALADIANASQGVKRATLFVDECLDALDRAGAEAVCTVIQELAIDRPVVVITHRDDAAELLNPALRVRVGAGKLTVTA